MFFNSLNDFNYYIPNCIVCGKQMKVHLLLSPIRYNDFSLTKLSLDIKDGIARSKGKGLSISIDIMNNKKLKELNKRLKMLIVFQ